MSNYKADSYTDELLRLLYYPEGQTSSQPVDPTLLLSSSGTEASSDSTLKRKASNYGATDSDHDQASKSVRSHAVNEVTDGASADKSVQNLFLAISARMHTLELIVNWVYQNQANQSDKIAKMDEKLTLILDTVNHIRNDIQVQGSTCQDCGSSDLGEDMSDEDISDFDLGPSEFKW